MIIALTNDDGVNEPGLAALAATFSEAGHDVLVVAPTSERSGSCGGGRSALENPTD